MKSAFEKKLRGVAVRCNGNLLLEKLAVTGLLAGIVATIAVLTQKILGVSFINQYAVIGIVGAVLVAALTWWFLRRPDALAVAVLLDQRMGTKERFSTAMSLADSEDPFAQAALKEAHDRANKVDIRRHFPIRPSRRWLYTAGCWALAGALLAWMPWVDALGYMKQKQAQDRKQQELTQVRQDVKDVLTPVQASVKQIGDAKLSKELAKLDDIKQLNGPDELRQKALDKLSDISDRIKEKQQDKDLQAASSMKEMLEQVRTFSKGQSRELNQAMAKGDFAKASQVMKELQQQLKDNKLSPEEKQNLAKQLDDLARQLDKISEENKQLKEELAKVGLDKELAELAKVGQDPKTAAENMKKLEEALKKAGLNKKQIDELMQKAASSQGGSNMAKKLAQAMGKAAGSMDGQINPQDLADAAEQLDDMEMLDQQLKLAEASIEELDKAMAQLGDKPCQGGSCPGCGKCQGGGIGPWAAGDPEGQGNGTGSAGRGYGARPKEQPSDTKTLKTRVENSSSSGKVIASMYIKGPQVIGESRKELAEVVKATKESAAKAVSENQIPKKYEGAIKKYTDSFEKPN